MNPLRVPFAHFKAYHSHRWPIIQYSGVIGMAAFPLFYLLRFTKADAPFNDIGLRVVAFLLCAGLALRNHWPQRLQPYYLAYAYGTLLYCMPFFFVFTSLANGGGTVGVANTLMVVFFLVLLSDWRSSVLLLLIGIAAAVGLYVTVVPDPQFPRDYVARLPILVLVVIGGSVFKFAQKQAEADKVKRTYTALAGSIAHEMRNPLSQIRHNLERMQQALPAPTTRMQAQTLAGAEVDALYRHLAESEMAVRRGLQVISMTLDEVSDRPMDAGSFSYISAAEATAKAVREYGYESESDRARVGMRVVEDFNFRGDETAYLFVLFNLIKNALYYAALTPQAAVTITIDRQKVMVLDNGPGIAPEVRARLFEPFSSAGKSGGTGLGLAYCRRVMHAFGGEIECASARGHYTRFTLQFPEIGQAEAEEYRQAVLSRARTAFAGKRLLVVDDDASLRMVTRHKLQPLEAVVDEAGDGAQAMVALARQRYDLIVLDLNMPGLDGYAVAERIRAGEAPANRDVCIVAYTSEPAHVASVKTQKAGMDGFVGKPCAQLPLVQALHHALAHPVALARPAQAQLGGRRVLLADDSPHNRKAVAAYLQHAGALVVEADHGHAVLELLEVNPGGYDAVVMDINMAGTNGLDTARAIRSGPLPWSEVPIVALTAHSDDAMVQAAREAGMNGFLTKPVDAGVLYAKLREVMGHGLPVTARAAVQQSADAVLDIGRLQSYQRMGMLEELLDDYLPEIGRLVARLESGVARQDMQESLDALHALLGMSGEAGASALYQAVRRIYVPMLEDKHWPAYTGWTGQIRTLAEQAERSLRAYGAAQSQAGTE